MMRGILFFSSLTFLVFTFGCAKRCPADINLGKLNLSQPTISFLPTTQRTETMQFSDNNGAILTFKNQNPDWAKRTKLDVEVLCDRGDFLDKTTQTAFFNTESYHLYYRSTDEQYSIGIDLQLHNDNFTGARKDTVLYETFAVSMYGVGPKSPNGVISILTDIHGNENKIEKARQDASTIARFVADTTIAGRNLKNVYVTPNGQNRNIFLFYTKAKGLEAFWVDEKIWFRQ
jgi:hypothetical protein